MTERTLFSKSALVSSFIGKSATLSCLLIISKQALALGEFLEKQSADQLSTGMFILLGVLAVLLLIVGVQFWLSSKTKLALQELKAEHQQRLDKLPAGIIHTNLDGKVIYANATGATMLGRQHEKLINSDFSANFDQEYLQQIEQSLTGDESNLQARAKSSNLYLRVQFGETVTVNNAYRVLTLTSENNMQRNLLQATEQRDHQAHLISASELAQVHLDFENDTCIHDHLFDSLLLIGAAAHKDDLSAPSIGKIKRHFS
jgi:transcriptional regulator of aromatic amino acid metabolism